MKPEDITPDTPGTDITDALQNAPSAELFSKFVQWLHWQAEGMDAVYTLMAMARFIQDQFAGCASVYAEFDTADNPTLMDDPDEWMNRMMRAIMDHATDDRDALMWARYIIERYKEL